MPLAISLAIDNATAAPIHRLWDGIGAYEHAPSQRGLGYHPHLTLAIYQGSDVSEQQAIAATRAAIGAQVVRCSFDHIATFEGDPLVFWLAPAPNADLLRLHALIHAAIDPALCHPYYRPDAWTPHVTLASDIRPDAEQQAKSFAERFTGTIHATFDRLDCIAFQPVRIAESLRLADRQDER